MRKVLKIVAWVVAVVVVVAIGALWWGYSTATRYYAQLLKVCARADAGARPELADARAFVTRTSGR